MQDIHELRKLLFEADRMAQRLSAAVSAGQVPADLAGLVDAARHSVLTAMRVVHCLELGTLLTRKVE